MSFDGTARGSLLLVDESPHELIVVKPAGLPSELPRDPAADSLARRLIVAGVKEPRLVHRLDAVSCGLLLVAKSPQAAAHYAAEIAAHRWHKWYVARVEVPHEAAMRLVGPHKAYLRTDGPSARVVRAGGKPSFLDVVSAAPAPGERGASDVLVRLRTGRFHQIRVMLAHLGAPLRGDTRYGGAAGAAVYLEHVVLTARPYASDAWRTWQAPRHQDRPAWDPTLADAVQRQIPAAGSAPRD